jgi:hypothetical protein
MKLTEAEKEKRRAYYHANKQKFIDKAKEWKKANPEKVRESQKKTQARSKLQGKDGHLKRKYGISLKEFEAMFTTQNGACKICKTPFKFYGDDGDWSKTANVDHCHDTGKVRGLLCNNCNRGLGFFKDNSTVLRLAAEYLDEIN